MWLKVSLAEQQDKKMMVVLCLYRTYITEGKLSFWKSTLFTNLGDLKNKNHETNQQRVRMDVTVCCNYWMCARPLPTCTWCSQFVNVCLVNGNKANSFITKSIPLHKPNSIMLITLSASGCPQEISLPCINSGTGALCAKENFSRCRVNGN